MLQAKTARCAAIGAPLAALKRSSPAPRAGFSPQTAPRSSIKMPSNIPVAPKSQYEIERDERIKRNEAFMLSIGIDPHGGGYVLSSA